MDHIQTLNSASLWDRFSDGSARTASYAPVVT